jgi:hypothetical protein
MYQLSVLQNQWLILALFGGIVLTLSFAAFYIAMWRPRIESPEPISGGRALVRWIPLFIIILFICIVIFQITYTVILHFYPPNI